MVYSGEFGMVLIRKFLEEMAQKIYKAYILKKAIWLSTCVAKHWNFTVWFRKRSDNGGTSLLTSSSGTVVFCHCTIPICVTPEPPEF